MKTIWLNFIFIALVLSPSPAQAAGGELKQGRYVGYIKLDDTGEKVALIGNTFIVQPEDFTKFPKLNAIFTMFLGGYGAPEYVTETFEDIRYDFSNGQLSLDEPENDLVITAEINDTPSTHVVGQVWIRSAARSGTICIEYESDEPGGGEGCPDDGEPFMSSLRGQYEGFCGTERAAIQITTGKGLAEGGSQRGLHGYGIAARLAFDQPDVCGEDGMISGSPVWCVSRTFTSGEYNHFAGKLTLSNARITTSCTLEKGRLRCGIQTIAGPVSCDLQKTDLATLPYRSFGRSSSVRTTADERLPLPEPAPPKHTELVQALRGQFYGYIHNELTNRYQPLRLNVIPTVATINPHNENEIFVSTTAVTHFGRTMSQDFWPQQLEKRSFYLRPGFTLESPNTDGFLQIIDWRKGYITGVWYSHAYGRVGTVQLVKGTALPTLDEAAKVTPSIDGQFRGPSMSSTSDLRWTFASAIPTQPVGRKQSTFSFEGSTLLSGGIIPPIRVALGTYDIYTGALSWLSAEDAPRMVMGQVDDTGQMSLLWPGASIWGVRMSNYGFVPFRRLSE